MSRLARYAESAMVRYGVYRALGSVPLPAAMLGIGVVVVMVALSGHRRRGARRPR